MSIHLKDGFLNQSVDHVLEDILVRFVVNVPKEDLSSLERVCFQVEEGQWFYTDFVRLLDPSLPAMKMKSFAPKILSKCPLVWKWGNPSDALSQFGKYKSTIPVRGIALMNKDLTKVVLVRGPESGTWSFPRGKISKDETDIECAIREVREETSFDARKYVNENDVLERTIGGKNFRIFLARNVPEDFNFEPLVRCEIADIKWFNIKTLRKSVRTNHSKYYVVNAMMEPLVGWVNKQKGLNNEDALMREAELKLKQLMGIAVTEEPEANNDAGRELLNILQGSKSLDNTGNTNGNWNGPVNVPMTLPQHLQDIYAGPGLMPQFLPPFYQNGMPPVQFPVPNFNGVYGKPFQPPPPPQPIQQRPAEFAASNISHAQSVNSVHSSVANPVPVAPSTALGEKSSLANSKELLSILKGKPAAPKILKKETEQAVNSNIVGPAPKHAEVPAKKITLLKRDKSSNESDSATLLSILGKKPPSPESPKSQATEGDSVASNAPSFLSILNSGRKNSEVAKPLAQPTSRSPAFSQTPPSHILSSSQFLGSVTPQGYELPAQEGVQQTQLQSDSNLHEPSNKSAAADLSAPAQFLNLLKKGSVSHQSPDVNPPANQFGLPQTHAAVNDQAQPPKLDLSAGNQILSMLNRNTDTPKNTRYNTPPVNADFSNFENFDDFEDFEDFDDISESQKDIYNSIANNFDVASDEDDYFEDAQLELPTAHPPTTAPIPSTSVEKPSTLPISGAPSQGATNSAGAGLLLLLQGGQPPNRGPYLSLQDTYGAQDQVQLQQMQLPVAPAFDSRRASNGALILRLLKREKQ